MKKINASGLFSLIIAALVYTTHANVCNETNLFWKKVSPSSGCLQRPILFVHGLGRDLTFWGAQGTPSNITSYTAASIPDKLSAYFKAGVRTSSDLNNNGIEFFSGVAGASTPGMASTLTTRISEILNEYFGERWKTDLNLTLDIVAHSQGGVAIREAIRLNNYGNSISNPLNHIHHIITMGSPHLGTSVTLAQSGYKGLDDAKNILRGTLDTPLSGSAWYGPFAKIWVRTSGIYKNWTIETIISGISTTYQAYDGSKLKPRMEKIVTDMEAIAPDLQKGSNLINTLSTVGFPKRSFDNSLIPLTTMYSTASTTWLQDVVAPAWSEARAGVVAKASEFSAGEEAGKITNSMFSDFKPYLVAFDKDWSSNSDLLVEGSSAIGSGLFSQTTSPFRTVFLGSDVLHGSKSNPITGVKMIGQEDVAADPIINSLQTIPLSGNIANALRVPSQIKEVTTNYTGWTQQFFNTTSGLGSVCSYPYGSKTYIKLKSIADIKKMSFNFTIRTSPLFKTTPVSLKVINDITNEVIWTTTNFGSSWQNATIDFKPKVKNVRIEFAGLDFAHFDDLKITTLNMVPVLSMLLL